MANNWTNNPFVIDSAGTYAGWVKISKIRWVSEGSVAGQNVVVKDSNGKEIWKSTAAGANHEDSDRINEWFNGINVETIESGTLYIYFD